MRCFIVISGANTLLVASNLRSPSHPDLVRRLKANDIHRVILLEVSSQLVRQRYGDHYKMVTERLSDDDFRVVDFNGASVFRKFSFSEMGEPIMVEF